MANSTQQTSMPAWTRLCLWIGRLFCGLGLAHQRSRGVMSAYMFYILVIITLIYGKRRKNTPNRLDEVKKVLFIIFYFIISELCIYIANRLKEEKSLVTNNFINNLQPTWSQNCFDKNILLQMGLYSGHTHPWWYSYFIYIYTCIYHSNNIMTSLHM